MRTVPARSARHVIDLATLRVGRERLARAAKLDLDALAERDARIAMSSLVELYELAAELTGDRCFGMHVGERVDLRAYGIFGYLVLNSPTLGDALRDAATYLPIYTDGATLSVVEDAHHVALQWQYADARLEAYAQDSEMTLATAARVTRQLTGRRCVREVHLRRPPPRDPAEHERLLCARVHFRMPSNQLVFARSDLERRIPSADLELRSLLVQRAALELATKPEDLVAATRRIVRASLCDGVRISVIARRLGTSPRTLQRKLGARGTSFGSLLAAVRRELAEEQLADPSLGIGDIAARLGYSHARELHRAFHTWTGMGPQEYRRLLSTSRN